MNTTDRDPHETLAHIRAQADAATEGPWAWGGNVDSQNLRLQTWNHRPDGQSCGVVQIMDFVRQGMQGAQPRFMEDLMMVTASDRAIYEVAPTATSRKDPRVYRGDIVGIKHPDAEFIAAARTTVPALVNALEAVLKLHVRAECPTCGSRDGEGNEFHKCDDDAYCEECDLEGYPCPTVAAITTALEGETDD